MVVFVGMVGGGPPAQRMEGTVGHFSVPPRRSSGLERERERADNERGMNLEDGANTRLGSHANWLRSLTL